MHDDASLIVPTSPETKPRRPRASIEAFDAFWREYPRGDEKKDAREYWLKSIFADEVPEIMAGLAKAKESADWQKDGGQFVPYAIRFLRKRRWEDEHRAQARAPSEQRPASHPPRFAGQQTQEVIRRRLERHGTT